MHSKLNKNKLSSNIVIIIENHKGLVKHTNKSIDVHDEIIMPDLRQVIFILKDAWNFASKGTIVN